MRSRTGIGFFAAVLFLLARGGTPAPGMAPALPGPRAACVFTNPGYAGKCVQTVDVPKDSSPGQACETVLRCLNDVGCLKTYCDATTIRSGWKLESAKLSGSSK